MVTSRARWGPDECHSAWVSGSERGAGGQAAVGRSHVAVGRGFHLRGRAKNWSRTGVVLNVRALVESEAMVPPNEALRKPHQATVQGLQESSIDPVDQADRMLADLLT